MRTSTCDTRNSLLTSIGSVISGCVTVLTKVVCPYKNNRHQRHIDLHGTPGIKSVYIDTVGTNHIQPLPSIYPYIYYNYYYYYWSFLYHYSTATTTTIIIFVHSFFIIMHKAAHMANTIYSIVQNTTKKNKIFYNTIQ